MLTLAATYRLARHFISPVAGLFATIVAASNAFSNYYIAHVRMYSLLTFLAVTTLWLYLRLLKLGGRGSRRHYFFLCISVFSLLNTHVFSIIFGIVLSIYHLHAAFPVVRHWYLVMLAAAVAIVFSLPWLLIDSCSRGGTFTESTGARSP